MPDPRGHLPGVTEQDLEWVRGLMGLRALDEPRRRFLMDGTTRDVFACPGSGKTTLIVAKLAVLARHWRYRARGLCVLSHTNAAREEIQSRLRETVVGAQLLSYPHFIDTIHGFVNRFLALPWLQSNGFPSATIDDEVTTAYRRRAIGAGGYRTLQTFLENRRSGLDKLRFVDRHLEFQFPAGRHTASYRLAKQAIEASAHAGYFCYDEMFVWARALLEDQPHIARWLQQRFPLVLIDEMQDTSAQQWEIVSSVFPRDSPAVTMQRVGDPNQAIYDGPAQGPAAPTGFPDAERCYELSKSFRFGPSIAALASPFAVEPVGADGLQGEGPRALQAAPNDCRHAVIVFPAATTDGVLDAYGQHVLSTFDDQVLEDRAIAAVGAVHVEADDVPPGHAQFPKTVPHYWHEYSASLVRPEPNPRSMVQYFRLAQAAARRRGALAPGVERVATGLGRFARSTGGGALLGRRAIRHRTLVEALAGDEGAHQAYRRLLRAVLIDGEPVSRERWGGLQVDVLRVLAGLGPVAEGPTAEESFLQWDDVEPYYAPDPEDSTRSPGPNTYRFLGDDGRFVDIRLGSIHSVKGQTHLATLLLSTFWYDHSAKQMLPWLLGDRANGSDANARDSKRLLQTYVAMTRPSHLLCWAVPDSALGVETTVESNLERLRERGWLVIDTRDAAEA